MAKFINLINSWVHRFKPAVATVILSPQSLTSCIFLSKCLNPISINAGKIESVTTRYSSSSMLIELLSKKRKIQKNCSHGIKPRVTRAAKEEHAMFLARSSLGVFPRPSAMLVAFRTFKRFYVIPLLAIFISEVTGIMNDGESSSPERSKNPAKNVDVFRKH